MRRHTLLVVALLAVMVGPSAWAQGAGRAQGSQAGSMTAAASELRERALRLTVLNSLPEEARAEAAALIDRAEALRNSEQELMVARLEAYVAALEAGESPQVAQDVATGNIAERSADVTREREALREEVKAFMEAHPDLRIKLMQAGQFGIGDGAMFDAGGLERVMGPFFGLGGSDHGAGARSGAERRGMHRFNTLRGAPRLDRFPPWLREGGLPR